MRDTGSCVFMASLFSFVLGAGGCAHQAAKNQSASAQPAASAQARPIEAAEPVVRNDELSAVPELAAVHFDFDSATVTSEEGAVLRKNADWLKANEGVMIQVAGHCDQRGTVAYNLALGQRRAAAVKDYYEKLGVSGARVATISYGREVPLCQDATEECWSLNRSAQSLSASPVNIGGVYAKWPRMAQLAARAMIDKHGRPRTISATELQWSAAGPWKKIVVHRDAASPLEQTIAYAVPADKLAALRMFHHGLTAAADEGSLSARSDNESANLLALNLAGDIATGKLSPAQADLFFTKAIRLYEAGKSSPYTERLLY